ncbi:MAG: tripartite tricarboxylate transporter permease [Candidatus Altiarchaeota archaeon]|nr:tripartite tricarboxylate transporter permease [Candidatus Altiarchaeota archaeon]
MIEYVLLILAGCVIGTITGLTPGLHVNTVCLIGLSLYPLLGMDALGFSVMMVATTLTQNFIDFIPSIFIGVPEEDTALSVLPTHKLVLQGKAMEAVKTTAYGCLLGVLFSLILLAPAMYIVPFLYNSVRGFVVYIISAAALILILREKGAGKIIASLAFLASGALGLIALDMKALSSSEVLFPVFSGLFGLSNLLYSLKTESAFVPQEEYVHVKIDRKIILGSLLGTLGGIAVGLLPAMSPSQIGIIMSSLFQGTTQTFLASLAAINTSDTIYSILALYTIGNPRSGVAVMMERIIDINANTLILIVSVMCIVPVVAFMIHLYLGSKATKLIQRIDYRKLSITVMLFVLTLVWVMTGWVGFIVCLVATAIGLIPILGGVSRTHAMGVLLIPTILYFLGVV